MYKIAVLGERESVLGFQALGLTAVIAEDAADARRKLLELARGDYAVIYLTEELAQALPDELTALGDRAIPAVILIPGKYGPLGIGRRAIHAAVERAVGADILS